MSKWWTDLKSAHEDYRNWKNLTPSRKMNCFFNIGNRISKLIGIYVFDKCQLNLYSYFPGAVVSVYFFLVLYTIFKNTSSGNFAEGIKCLPISGFYISVGFK